MEKNYSFVYKHYDSLEEMTSADRELVLRAKDACDSAYAPYSNFRVGAAARLRSGKIITGSNQESEVYPAGVCAERSLLFHHQSHYKDDPIAVMAIASKPDPRECYPCGICRQVLADTEKRQASPIRVIMAGREGATEVESARDLLPFLFQL